MDLTEMQILMNQVRCPNCSAEDFDVKLRCDLGIGECLATASCQNCKTVYELSTEGRVLEAGKQSIGSHQCPACRGREVSMAFRCELPSRKCLYVAQ